MGGPDNSRALIGNQNGYTVGGLYGNTYTGLIRPCGIGLGRIVDLMLININTLTAMYLI